jgi:hypothetical protein
LFFDELRIHHTSFWPSFLSGSFSFARAGSSAGTVFSRSSLNRPAPPHLLRTVSALRGPSRPAPPLVGITFPTLVLLQVVVSSSPQLREIPSTHRKHAVNFFSQDCRSFSPPGAQSIHKRSSRHLSPPTTDHRSRTTNRESRVTDHGFSVRNSFAVTFLRVSRLLLHFCSEIHPPTQ